MSSDLLLSHLKSVKSSITPSGNAEQSNKRKRGAGAAKEVDYAQQARTHLSQKKARIDHRIQITALGQPAKKNKKKLGKLIKLAKAAAKS
jgi:hypothetical protein